MNWTVQLAPGGKLSVPLSRLKRLVPSKSPLRVQLPAVTLGPALMPSVGVPAAKVLRRLSLICTLGVGTAPVLPTVRV